METRDTLLLFILGVIALAFILQSLAIVGIFLRVRRMTEQVARGSHELTQRAGLVLDGVVDILRAVKPVAEHIQTININIASMTTTMRDRTEELDKLVGELAGSVRQQAAKISEMIERTGEQVTETLVATQRLIYGPISEFSAVFRAIRAGLDILLRRHSGRRAAQDEELFI